MDKSLEECKALIKEMSPSTDFQHLDILKPFADNSNLCLIKSKKRISPGFLPCNSCQAVDGLLYDWSMGKVVLSPLNTPKVFSDQNLPMAYGKTDSYQSCIKHTICENLHRSGDRVIQSIDVAKGDMKYMLHYPGLRFRLFKYATKVYIITYDGDDGKSVMFSDKLSVWDAFALFIGCNPVSLFQETFPHGDLCVHYILGDRRFTVTTSRTISGTYLICTHGVDMAYVSRKNLPSGSIGKITAPQSMRDNASISLGQAHVVLTPLHVNMMFASQLFKIGFRAPNYQFTNCGEPIDVLLNSNVPQSAQLVTFKHPNTGFRVALMGPQVAADPLQRAAQIMDDSNNVLGFQYSVDSFPRASYRITIQEIKKNCLIPTGINNTSTYQDDKLYVQDCRLRNYLALLNTEQQIDVLEALDSWRTNSFTLLDTLKKLKYKGTATDIVTSEMGISADISPRLVSDIKLLILFRKITDQIKIFSNYHEMYLLYKFYFTANKDGRTVMDVVRNALSAESQKTCTS